MERKNITKKSLENYESFLRQEEKSQATVEKYLREIRVLSVFREIRVLSVFMKGAKISKPKILEYRERLIETYQPKTVNTKLSAINSYLEFSGL